MGSARRVCSNTQGHQAGDVHEAPICGMRHFWLKRCRRTPAVSLPLTHLPLVLPPPLHHHHPTMTGSPGHRH